MAMIITNVTGFQIPSSAILRFQGPQQTWGWGSDSVGRAVFRSYGKRKVSVPFRELLTDSEGKLHWWGNRQCSHILDVTSAIEVTLKVPILDAQCVQYSHWWSHNHHFYRWHVGGLEILRSQVFLSDSQGQPIPGTNYSSAQEITFKEMEALASTMPEEQEQAIAWVTENGAKTTSISGKTQYRVWESSMKDLTLHQTVPAVFLAAAGGATVDHDSVTVEI